MKKQLITWIAVIAMLAGTIVPDIPVYAAEIAEVQELETGSEEEIAAEADDAADSDDADKVNVQEAEPILDEADSDSLMAETEEPAGSEDIEEEDAAADEEISEDIPEEEPAEKDIPEEAEEEISGEDELFDGGYIELPENADAEFFAAQSPSASYKLVCNSVITLADGDDIKLGSIVKESDESDYSLTIKAADGNAGTGKLTVGTIDLSRKKTVWIYRAGSLRRPIIYAQALIFI